MTHPKIMKIATWNLERPKMNGKKTPAIIEFLKGINADNFILTETETFIDLGDEYFVRHSEKDKQEYFREGERRVSIFSKYPITNTLDTFRADTSLCVSLDTPKGELIIYGTVIGNRGNKGYNFKEDLEEQLLDFNRHSFEKNFCIAGDFNISFSDSYYTIAESREKLLTTFDNLGMEILTKKLPENIDHIVLTNTFYGTTKPKIETWNEAKNLSDHKGVWIEIID
jgi:exonuclease III